jgi:hypothetical protein
MNGRTPESAWPVCYRFSSSLNTAQDSSWSLFPAGWLAATRKKHCTAVPAGAGDCSASPLSACRILFNLLARPPPSWKRSIRYLVIGGAGGVPFQQCLNGAERDVETQPNLARTKQLSRWELFHLVGALYWRAQVPFLGFGERRKMINIITCCCCCRCCCHCVLFSGLSTVNVATFHSIAFAAAP